MAERRDSFGMKPDVDAVEDIIKTPHHEAHDASGTVNLYQDGTVVLVPTPSPDPKDPLNLPVWRKYMIILLVGFYSGISVLGTSGLGSVAPELYALYRNDNAKRVSDLLTYPTLFMGIGNLLSMPLANAIGRRPVFLFSLLLLTVSGIWCACSKSLTSHIAGRNIFSLAAGQSEALAPLIVQEIHFLHQHGVMLSYFVGVQNTLTAALFTATTYIVPSLGLPWWYGIMTIINGFTMIMSILFLAETRYDRPEDATEGAVHLKLDKNGNVAREGTNEVLYQVTTRNGVVLQPEKFGERTWRDDIKLFHGKADWRSLVSFYKDVGLSLILPPIFWIFILNGAFLGLYIYQASTFAQILVQPPYNFNGKLLGYVQLVQIIDCLLAVPLLGFGSDIICKFMSRRNKGVFEPEYRLIVLIIPAACAIISAIVYGHAAASPNDYHWIAIVAPYHLGFFSFLGANLVGITFVMDSYPNKSGPLLLVVCAGRGFVSFGLSYATVPSIESLGYDGAMNILAIICGVLSAMGIVMYFIGKRVREWARRRIWPKHHEE
ncbi:HOL1 [Fusarium tjaetaba]|uniref:HOL1 n=1 Tax=Fusarium tjaetaba TaxID=1567544 RepID=A0A8H5S3F1_9HYPO|nr:HOL1 [Fusarium tjaetaba]KAF5645851.1 HOL1 [Fusarium tjaetaba]